MKIVRLRIRNFRCIKFAELFPVKHNVLLGPNNTGKTAVLEALNLLLNPESSGRWTVIDENDFFSRDYTHTAGTQPTPSPQPVPAAQPTPTPQTSQAQVALPGSPLISIEAVLCDLTQQDEDVFGDYLVPWKADSHIIVENTPEGVDPFAAASSAIRVMFEATHV